ncbi:hypothetical protein O6H91_03G019100 [Diphasiastrum complanatum]|uniref:Uncharacterized protein n=6 Tax=Diphasiastrum complanatum TaxID=34168 RepID=A0ACC2E4R3_DIPCM|nr:hypothetical protein O6H91_03G019100 [Diphasiastrum complanatum]KAJ7561213.1 hypothetical protein O6H91_03G019100 [Diphasiastrum complanatum]KAJ7561214.1 hypothetical protein O6H91_03G019100 [Diphasiastrum complanatum]KAJ7561215.1 hypothetical protein O6H91_03G019100 [Diphasiastrum complanatum]KAJ7561216.1 hypothetical protein O6H91_03G019100 [Diphasiastrum complanatum]
MYSSIMFRSSVRKLCSRSILKHDYYSTAIAKANQFLFTEAAKISRNGLVIADAQISGQETFASIQYVFLPRQSDVYSPASLPSMCRHWSSASVDDDKSVTSEGNGVKASQADDNQDKEGNEMKADAEDLENEALWNVDLEEDDDISDQEGDAEGAEEAIAQADGETSLFSSATSLSKLQKIDLNKYFTLKQEDKVTFFGEGLPAGLTQEFEATDSGSFLIRGQMVHLCERLQRDLTALEPRKHYVLDGPVGSGKSVTLAMLVMWARSQGWLVFYVPFGKEWTHGGMYAKNERTGLWDTPIQAKSVLEGFLRSHDELLGLLKCHVVEPLYLGEVPGLPLARGPQHMILPENSSLKDLIQQGLAQPHVAVAVVVRLREELSLVTDVPVLFAIDQFNSWFTFSEYHQYMGPRKRRPIHARELAMVNAFRKMEEGSPFYVSAFSHSTAVGKLPKQLPGVPRKARFRIHRFNIKETSSALEYYHMQKLASNPPTDQDVNKLFFLTNGNGSELRTLARLM